MITCHSSPVDAGGACPDWWEPLHRASANASIFTDCAWIETWLAVFGDQFVGQWVRWEIDGHVVGGCLLLGRTLRRRAVLRLRALFVNATGEASGRTPLAEFNDVLCLSGHEDAVARDFVRLLQEEKWDCLCLSGFETGGVLSRVVSLVPLSRVTADERPAPFVDLLALQDAPFEHSLSSNARGQVRRSRRLYEELEGPVTLASAADPQEAGVFFDELVRLSNRRWSEKRLEGSFESAEVVQFHRRLLDRLWSAGEVELLRVRAGAHDIGYLHNFRRSGKVYFFQSGFAYQADSRLKPGLVTHSLAIEHYRTSGEREYDFLAGDARYKRTLAKSSRTLVWSVAYRDSAWFRLLFRVRDGLRAAGFGRRDPALPEG